MKYKAIIFDMDGTIIDTEHIWLRANRELICKRGIELTPEMEKELGHRLNGVAMVESVKIIKEVAGLPDDLADLIVEKGIIADALYEKGVRFIKGFLEFHAKVMNLNLPVGLATNATDQTLAITDKKLNLQKLFGQHIYNISHVNNQYKPNPAIYLHAAKQLKVDPTQCIAIEDSSTGIQAARAAGMFCIGINTSKKPERLIASHLIINEYHEIDLQQLLFLKS